MHKSGDVLQARYEVERVLGQGGMGGVYLATHRQLDVKVAVKEMTCDISDPEERLSAVRQFRKEAQTLHLLRHRNLPRVHDFFEEDGKYYLVMDYIEGRSLDAVIRTQPLPEDVMLRYNRELCDVLRYLHTHDPPIIFRDLKPSNIMLEQGGQIKLIDFGIAKDFDRATGRGTQTSVRGSGTPGFAAPEQYGTGSDVRTDVYALGATLYCLLTRIVPPDSVDLAAGSAELRPLRDVRPDVSVRTARIIAWMMSIKRTDRPAGIDEVAAAFEGTGDVPERSGNRTVAAPADRETLRPAVPQVDAGAPTVLPGESPAVLVGAPPTALMTAPAPVRRSGAAWLVVLAVALVALLAGVRQVLFPPTVALSVTSEPSGADLIVNGHLMGSTPEEVHVPTGRDVTVEVSKEGYESYRHTLPAGQPLPMVRLAPLPRMLSVQGTPAATLVVDGQKLGRVGDTLSNYTVAVGKHRLTIEAEGYQPRTMPLDVKVAQDPPLETYSLTPRAGGFQVTASVGGVHVAVDGGKPQPVPCRLTLSPGAHTLHASAAGYHCDRTVKASPGVYAPLKLAMVADSAPAATPQTVVLVPPSPPAATATPGVQPSVSLASIMPGRAIGAMTLGGPASQLPPELHQVNESIYAAPQAVVLVDSRGVVAAVGLRGTALQGLTTVGGVRAGSDEATIQREFGPPGQQRAFRGGMVGLDYPDKGIGFILGTARRVQTVYIFPAGREDVAQALTEALALARRAEMRRFKRS